MKIQRFEEINAWQEARTLVSQIYKTVNANSRFKSDFRFASQITSSAVSVMANIAEGFGRKSTKEFVRYFFISKGSLAEVQSQLYVAKDLKYIDERVFQQCYDQADKTAKMISRFITYLKTKIN